MAEQAHQMYSIEMDSVALACDGHPSDHDQTRQERPIRQGHQSYIGQPEETGRPVQFLSNKSAHDTLDIWCQRTNLVVTD